MENYCLTKKIKNIVPHKLKVDNFTARLLNNDDKLLVQKFYDDNADFFEAFGSHTRADEIFTSLPPNKTLDDKFLIGLFDGEQLVVFVDIIQNCKTEGEWALGTFVVAKNYRRKGIGKKFLSGLENLLLTLGVKRYNIVVQKENENTMKFWLANGMQKFGEREPNDILMSKKLEKKEPTITDKYFKNGKLTSFPSKPQEQLEVYKIIQSWFEKGKTYSEMEVNNIIKSGIECRDHVTLRRDLVDHKLLNRSSDGKEYSIYQQTS